MRIPGFSAELSLQSSGRSYQAALQSAAAAGVEAAIPSGHGKPGYQDCVSRCSYYWSGGVYVDRLCVSLCMLGSAPTPPVT